MFMLRMEDIWKVEQRLCLDQSDEGQREQPVKENDGVV